MADSLLLSTIACYTFFELCRNIASIGNGCKYTICIIWKHTLCSMFMLMFMCMLWLDIWLNWLSLLTSHPNTCTACYPSLSLYAYTWIWILCVSVYLHHQQVQKPAQIGMFNVDSSKLRKLNPDSSGNSTLRFFALDLAWFFFP